MYEKPVFAAYKTLYRITRFFGKHTWLSYFNSFCPLQRILFLFLYRARRLVVGKKTLVALRRRHLEENQRTCARGGRKGRCVLKLGRQIFGKGKDEGGRNMPPLDIQDINRLLPPPLSGSCGKSMCVETARFAKIFRGGILPPPSLPQTTGATTKLDFRISEQINSNPASFMKSAKLMCVCVCTPSGFALGLHSPRERRKIVDISASVFFRRTRWRRGARSSHPPPPKTPPPLSNCCYSQSETRTPPPPPLE